MTRETTAEKREEGPSGKRKRKKKASFRENVESLAVAVILALTVRYFVVEAFKIPTGSMAPTLLGMHTDVVCPNCFYKYALNIRRVTGTCPNCLAWVSVERDGIKPWFIQRVFHFACETGLRIATMGWIPRLEWHGQNRILVNKFIYTFRKPKRWDVFVFLYPPTTIRCSSCGYMGEFSPDEPLPHVCPSCGSPRLKQLKRKNFIKRLVGLPGELLEIRNGDIYINGKIAHKPARVQNGLWQHVYDSRFVEEYSEIPGGIWKATGEGWEIGDDVLLFKNTSRHPSRIAFQRVIDDRYGYSGGMGSNVVGDIKIEFDVVFMDNKGWLSAGISEDDLDITCKLRAGNGVMVAGSKGGTSILEEEAGLELSAGKVHHVAFWNVDDSVGVILDRKKLIGKTFDFDAPEAFMTDHTSGVCLEACDTELRIENIRIQRDVYYTHEPTGKYPVRGMPIPKGCYFALGDNSPNSRDSRVWGYVPEDNLVGKAFVVFWPVLDVKLIK